MNKVLMVLAALLLVGCAEKAEYEQAVLEQVTQDKDSKDYNIKPEKMVDCVVATTAKKMPGLVPIDPTRRQAYINYTKMLKLNSSADPKKTMDELREAFGSPKELAEAHANFAESMVECLSGLVSGTEEESMK
ncbi:hypothetical protein IVG45_17425 [Methylomonas sp. LL1]|uniref:hypothetical protein n=1 Tax=Methylomonas sp. LL1 TaxID=2785785 RepID=UPI0018C35EFE|nr:hypothetical protein [Methylomonas sp. LL1]QPK62613.1 hypothetical protein IVG45_17425 [Methylomonas sp. LL1]